MYSKYFLALAGQMVESNFPNSSGKGGKKTHPNNPKSPPAHQNNLVFECRRAVHFLSLWLYSAVCQSGGKCV